MMSTDITHPWVWRFGMDIIVVVIDSCQTLDLQCLSCSDEAWQLVLHYIDLKSKAYSLFMATYLNCTYQL